MICRHINCSHKLKKSKKKFNINSNRAYDAEFEILFKGNYFNNLMISSVYLWFIVNL